MAHGKMRGCISHKEATQESVMMLAAEQDGHNKGGKKQMEEKTKKTTATAGVGNAVKIYFKENLGIIVAFLVLCVFLSCLLYTSRCV